MTASLTWSNPSRIGFATNFFYRSTRLRRTPFPSTHTRRKTTKVHTHKPLCCVITTLLWLHKMASKYSQASQLAPITFSALSSPCPSFSSVSCFSFYFSFVSCLFLCLLYPHFPQSCLHHCPPLLLSFFSIFPITFVLLYNSLHFNDKHNEVGFALIMFDVILLSLFFLFL